MDLKDTQTTKIDEYSLKETFISILTKDRKDNTYKFAFARALIEYCKMNPPTYGIPYSYFADKFLEYYWHQECRYKIKQDFTIKSMPKVIYAIRHVFKDNSYGSFSKVDYSKKQMRIIYLSKHI